VTQGVATTQAVTESASSPRVTELLDAQLAAISRGDITDAADLFASEALFSGPEADEVATDAAARALAITRFKVLHAAGFSPTTPLQLVGGEELPTVRWAAYRFGSKGALWSVTTLLSGPAPWKIIAQSWDKAEEDHAVLSMAERGELPPIGRFDDSLIPPDDTLVTWIDQRRARPTQLSLQGPLRGDTFGLGSAGEYVQSDEALMVIQAQQRRLYEAGAIQIDPMAGAGRLLRMSPDKAAGVALYHTGVIVETPQGPVTVPMRALSYFLLQSRGPRLIGGHFMATP